MKNKGSELEEKNTKETGRDTNEPKQLNRIMRGELKNKVVIRKLNGQYRLEERENKTVDEEWTQKAVTLNDGIE